MDPGGCSRRWFYSSTTCYGIKLFYGCSRRFRGSTVLICFEFTLFSAYRLFFLFELRSICSRWCRLDLWSCVSAERKILHSRDLEVTKKPTKPRYLWGTFTSPCFWPTNHRVLDTCTKHCVHCGKIWNSCKPLQVSQGMKTTASGSRASLFRKFGTGSVIALSRSSLPTSNSQGANGFSKLFVSNFGLRSTLRCPALLTAMGIAYLMT